MIGDKSLYQRRFTGACLGRDRDNPPPAFARACECIPQPSKLLIALEQVDSGIPHLSQIGQSLLCTVKVDGCTCPALPPPHPAFCGRATSPPVAQ
jgi:hypothetical protein